VAAMYFLLTFHKVFKISFSLFAARVYVKPILSSIFAAIITLVSKSLLSSLAFFSHTWGSVLWLSFELAVFFACYLMALIKMSYLERVEVESLTVYLKPKLANRISSLFIR